jgi:DNA-binding GntR family transcriptional regulator
MNNSGTAGPPQSRTLYVLERLKTDLERGTLAPGDQLRQSAIAELYGVSATPVREALRILAADGTIDYTPHRGASVRDFSPELARDLYRIRAEVEALAVRMSVERMTSDVLESIHEANTRLVEATVRGAEPEELSRLNMELHFAIYENSSPLMIEFLQYLWARFKPNVTLWGVAKFAHRLGDDHSEIIQAIDAGDADNVASLMRKHVMGAYELRQSNSDLRAAGDPTEARTDIAPTLSSPTMRK